MKSVDELIGELTLPEKAVLLEGYESWMTNAVPRLEVPSLYLTDGPVGVRRKSETAGEGVMGLGKSYPSTAFPTPASVSCSWDEELNEKIGRAIGQECVAYGVDVLLAPAMNLKRDPRCGRSFEYYSEDPLLSGRLAAAYVRGVQSTGTAACPKHFALNNCEDHRYMSDSVVDERAMRELYLKNFEICVREGRPRTMMCSYNKVNGTHCSENEWLLTDVLRNEWGFSGMVMTDWGATKDRTAGVKAGLDLDMPGGIRANRKAIIEGVENGSLSEETLDKAIRNVLNLIAWAQEKRRAAEHDVESARLMPGTGLENSSAMQSLLREHDELAQQAAEECAVLLKNDGLLPLHGNENLLIAGDLFEKMRYQGGGSSGLTPAHKNSPKEAFDQAEIQYHYERGYRETEAKTDLTLSREAINAADSCDTILFFGGLTDQAESEGFDRPDLSIPKNQLDLLSALCRKGKSVIAVLFGGSVMELPFADEVNAILYMGLPGQEGGEACRRLLYGEANPCGKLSETWMKTCADIPFGEKFSRGKEELYRENIFVGYRYFDNAPARVRYPFGCGLSYTQFSYSSLSVAQEDGAVTVKCTVSNTGSRPGAEIVQLYVGKNETTQVFKAQKELKAYAKVTLNPGEEKSVTMKFAEKDLAYYNTKTGEWVLENGTYPVMVGASSADIRLTGGIVISGQADAPAPYSKEVADAYNIAAGESPSIPDAVFAQTIGGSIPSEPPAIPFTLESPIGDYQQTRWGKFLYNSIMKGIAKNGRSIDSMPEGIEKEEMQKNQRFVLNLVPRNSARSLIQSGGGRMQMNIAEAIVDFANGHLLRALKAVAKKD